MTECNHIIAYEKGIHRIWLCFANDPPYGGEYYKTKHFNYCPLCGEVIEWQAGQKVKVGGVPIVQNK